MKITLNKSFQIKYRNHLEHFLITTIYFLAPLTEFTNNHTTNPNPDKTLKPKINKKKPHKALQNYKES